jgi:hypothetical protein
MMVTFRVSSDEHDLLTKCCLEYGARSVAEFARTATLQKAQMLRDPAVSLAGDLTTLSKGLRELDASLANIRERIQVILGPSGSRRSSGDEGLSPLRERAGV